MKLISMRLLAICLFGIVLAGCPDDSDEGTLLTIDDVDDARADGEGGDDASGEEDVASEDDTDTGEPGEARIRAMHVSPVAPPVDVYANGDGPVVEGLEYASGTPYLTVPDGQYLFSITPTGAPTEDAVLNANVSLDAGAIVSMAAFGTLDDLRALVIDDQTDGLDEDNVRLEVVHAAAGVSTVNILVVDGEEQSPLIEALGYGTTQGALDVPAGAYVVGIDTDDDLSADLQCEVPSLPAGEKVNVYAVLNDDDVQLVAQLPTEEAVISCLPAGPPPGDPARVRGIHLSPDAPSVDILANGSVDPLFSDLGYSQTSSFSEVPAGIYDISVVPTGAGPDASVFDVQGVGLLENERTTVAVYGRLEALQALYFVDVLEGLQPDLIRVRAVHTATDVGVVNLVSLGGEESQTIWENLNEGDVGASVDLPSQAYTVGIDVGADSSVELQCSLPALPAGSIVNVYAVNTEDGVQLVVQFAESTTTLTVNCTPIGTETGQARILHLSPDAPAVDAFVDGDGPIVSNLSFADGTGYYSLPVGPRTLNIAPAGVGIESSVIEATVEISADVSYSVVAFDNVASIKPLVLEDDTSAPTSGSIRIRPVHTAVGVGSVDLYAVLGTGALLPLTSELAFGTAGAALTVPAGEYVIGIDVDSNAEVDLQCPLAELQAGTIGNVFAVADAAGVSLVAHLGDGSATTFACEASVEPEPADVRLLHASPFAPGVDVFANGTAIASGLGYADGSDYLSVPAGAYDIALSPAGSGVDAAVASFNVSLAPGLAYSAIAYGELSDLQLLALADNVASPAIGNIRVRAVHAAVGVGAVDLYVGTSGGAAPTLLEQGLGFGTAGTEAEVPAGAYTVEFDVNFDGVLDLQCVLPELAAGTVANVVAVANNGVVSLIAHLNGGATASVDCAAVVQPGQGEVRAIHLSQDAPNVDVFANGIGPVFTDVPYTATSDYVSVDEGLLKLGVAAATSPPAAQPDYVLVTDVDIEADDSVTAVVFDNLSNLSALALIDDRTAPAAGNIRLRGIHATPGVPAVDVLVTTADGTTVPLYTGLAFGTAGDALEVAAGQYSVGLDVGGTGQADLVCDLPSLSAGFVANVFAAPNGTGVQLVVQPDTGASLTIPCAAPPAPETADVSVYHFAADVPAVDVAVNGTVAIPSLEFPGIVGPVALASGTTDVAVLLAGTSTDVLSGSLTLAPGANYSVAAYGSATEPGLLVLENDQSPIGAGNARIRVAHTAVGVGDVDLYTLADDGAASSLLSDLVYGSAADALDVPATEYSIGIDANGDGGVDLQCDTPALSEGTLYNLFAVNVDGAVRLLGAVEGLSAAFQITCNPVQAPTAQVAVYHVAPGVPAVDVSLDGEVAVSSLSFPALAGPLTVDAGTYDVVVATAATSAEVINTSLTLDSGVSYAVAAYGSVAAPGALVLTNTTDGIGDGESRIRVGHTALGVGTVDIFTVSDSGAATPLISDLEYGAASNTLDVPATAYTIGIDATGNGQVDLTCETPALNGGTLYNLFAVSLNGGVSLLSAVEGLPAAFQIPCSPVTVGQASVRVFHLSPSAPEVDVYANDAGPIISNLAYLTATDYAAVPSGAYTFDVTLSGQDDVVLSADLTLPESTLTTVVAYGAAESLAALALDDSTTPPATGNIRIRLGHTAVGVGTVNVATVFAGAPGVVVPLVEGFEFGDVSDPVEAPAGAYEALIDADLDGTYDLSCNLPSLTSGTVADIFAVNAGGVGLAVLLGDGTTVSVGCGPVNELGNGEVRVVHLSPDAPGVDVYANDDGPVISGLGYKSVSAYISVPEGDYAFDVTPAGEPGTVVLAADATIDEGTRSTVVAFDALAGIKGLILSDDVSPVSADSLRVRAVHTAVGVGTVDISASTGGGSAVPLFQNLDFGTASAAATVSAASYTALIDADQDGSADLECQLPQLPGGTAVDLFATNTSGAISLLAVLDGSSVDIACEAVAPAPQATVRTVHMSPDAPAVDIFANGEGPIVSGQAFLQGAGPLSVGAGSYTFDVAPSGAGLSASVLNVPNLTLEADTAYTVVAFNSVSNIEALLLTDPTDDIGDNVRLRYVHTAVGVGAVNLFALLPGGGQVNIGSNLAFGGTGTFLTGPNNPVPVGVDASGDGVIDFVCPTASFNNGEFLNIFLTLDGTILRSVVQRSSGGTEAYACTASSAADEAQVRVLHLSPDAPSVDVFANGAGPVVTSLPFLLGTGALTVPSGEYTFDVVAAGSPVEDAVLTVPNISLATGSSYTVVAYNTVGSIGALLLEDLVNPIATSSVRLRAVHTAVGVGTVDILAVSESGNTPLWSQVPFGGVGDAIDIPPGAYRVGLDVDGNGQPNLVASLPTLPGGAYANVFASVDAVGAASLVVQLGDGSTLNVPLLPFDAAGDALVRATFVGLQPGSVDFTFDGPESFSVAGVGENDVSEWFSVEAGTYSVNAVGGLFDVYQSSTELDLAAGDVISVVVYATDGTIFGTGIGTAVFKDDYSALSGRSSRIRTAHLDRNVGAVDVLQLQPTAQAIASNVEIGAVGGWFGTLAGAIQLGIDATGDGQADITYTSTPIPPGRAINTLVTEGDDGESEVVLFTRIGELEINPDGTGP